MTNIFIPAFCVFIAYKAARFIKNLREVRYVPGYRSMFSPLSLLGAVLPYSWFNYGRNWYWIMKDTAFFKYTHDMITIVPWVSGDPAYFTCSPEVTQQLLGNEGQVQLVRPPMLGSPLLLWGGNMFASNGEMWKRHRRVVSPAFGTKLYATVIQQTCFIYKDMMETEGWSAKSSVDVDGFLRITMRLAFLVISRCGFGISLSWSSDEKGDLNTAKVNDALAMVTETVLLRLMIPNWAYKLPIKRLHEIDETWKFLAVFMRDSIKSRAQMLSGDPELLSKSDDVFTRLVSASDNVGKYNLSEEEVIGNTFLLMFAGYETTALVLAATITFLAIHQDEQEKAYREITSVIKGGLEPTLEDLSKLPHTLACFNEALRMYPASPMTMRTMPQDVTVKVKRPAEETIVIKKDSLVIFNTVCTHRNPNFFPEPSKFKPSRWYDVSEHDITMFGSGPRSCIGRKFGHTEALTFLSLLLRDWHLDVSLRAGETREQFKERVMGDAGPIGMSFGVTGPMNLRLTRRP
ncbi:hypothetical protein NLJ89_g3084 [Agrocybe chaxingu]|uniref:Cytochrome P450 n=1 Tax=Agrocybe chaxingu TaxID=84603 RepID=A0A9W8K5J9_9AGAR|nr:hypothetical protein NLJ89_g3084 [Agrocybe chaxingu]